MAYPRLCTLSALSWGSTYVSLKLDHVLHALRGRVNNRWHTSGISHFWLRDTSYTHDRLGKPYMTTRHQTHRQTEISTRQIHTLKACQALCALTALTRNLTQAFTWHMRHPPAEARGKANGTPRAFHILPLLALASRSRSV